MSVYLSSTGKTVVIDSSATASEYRQKLLIGLAEPDTTVRDIDPEERDLLDML